MALLQVGFVLAHGPAPDKHVALQARHGTAHGHDHRVDLDGDLARRGEDKHLQQGEEKASLLSTST